MSLEQSVQFVSTIISFPIAIALLMAVIFQPRPTRLTILFSVYGAAVSLWSFANFNNAILAPKLMSDHQELWLQITGISLTVSAFYFFVVFFVSVKGQFARTMAYLGLMAQFFGVIIIWSGKVADYNDAGQLELSSVGYGLMITTVLYLAHAFLLLRQNPSPQSRVLQLPAILLMLGIASNGIPLFLRFPIDNITAAIATLLIGRQVLRFQLFNPLQDAIRDLNKANGELQLINQQLSIEKSKVDALNHDLHRANEYRTAFLANMSHELRTPLNSILGYATLMLEGMYGEMNTAQTDRLRVINRNGKNLLGLINDILDLSKIQAGRMKMYPEELELSNVVEELKSTVEPLVAEKKNPIKFSAQISTDLHTIYVDKTRIRQVLLNLLSNAIKFTKEGEVGLMAENIQVEHGKSDQIDLPSHHWLSDGEWVLIRVKDTGIGIPPSQFESIFQDFQQVDGSSTREYEGTGLGLAIVKRLVELQEGQVWVKSEVNVGSEFFVAFPKHGTSVKVLDNPNAPIALLIDEDRQTADLLAYYLREAGYRLIWSNTGQVGLQQAYTLQPAVILVEIQLPDLNGWDLIQQLKNYPATSAIPYIILSSVDERRQGLDMGISGYILKPLEKDKFVRTLEEARENLLFNNPILIIEDDPNTRDLLSRHLKTAGYPSHQTADGLAALKWLDSTDIPPALVLLDLKMQPLNGFEVLQKIRLSPKFSHLPIMVVTSLDLSPAERNYLENNHAHITYKSALNDPEDLLADIKRVVSRQ